jgi:hypothetical protein
VREVTVGFAAGVAAFVCGFVATAIRSDAQESREAVERLLGDDGPLGVSLSELLPEWYHVLSWEFLENHQVAVSAAGGDLFGGGLASEYVDTLLPTASTLQVLPPLSLAGAGLFVALYGTRTSPLDAVLAGATAAVGYLPCLAVVAVVSSFEVTVFGSTLVEVDPGFIRPLAIAGVAHPVVFGGIGGLCAFGLTRWRQAR